MNKLTDDLKLKIYPAVIGVLGICLIASLLSRYEISVWTEKAPLEPELSTPSASDDERSPSPSLPDSSSPNSSLPNSPLPVSPDRPTAEPSPSPDAAPQPTSPAIAQPPPAPGTVLQGSLRVSNQTNYPIRVALLSQAGTSPDQITSETSVPIAYAQPVHWDFAPSEGKRKGLKLSLPDGTLQIQTGDVLVAFAQDGSRRYWGPYVVGETQFPVWNSGSLEWELNLQR
jgi:hypothetical protein